MGNICVGDIDGCCGHWNTNILMVLMSGIKIYWRVIFTNALMGCVDGSDGLWGGAQSPCSQSTANSSPHSFHQCDRCENIFGGNLDKIQKSSYFFFAKPSLNSPIKELINIRLFLVFPSHMNTCGPQIFDTDIDRLGGSELGQGCVIWLRH